MKLLIKRYFVFFLSILFILYSLIRYKIEFTSFLNIPRLYKQEVKASGIVDNIEHRNLGCELILRNVSLSVRNIRIDCDGIIVSADYLQHKLKHGMRVDLEGEISSFSPSTNPGEFDFQSYYYIRNIYYRIKKPVFIKNSNQYNVLKYFLYLSRTRLCENIKQSDKSKNKRVSGIINTILLGDKTNLDKEIKALYQKNGISHILAISGLHVWVIGGGIYKALKKIGLSLKFTCVASVLFLSLYIGLIGFGVSSFRAYVMMSVFFVSILIKRTYSMITAWSVALIFTLILNYKYIYDSGFILSYSAILSIIFILPTVSSIIKNKYFIKFGLSAILALQIGMLPIILSLFYGFSPYSILLNMIVIPFVFPLLILGILAGVFSCFSSFLAGLILTLSGTVIFFINLVCEFISKLPFSYIVLGKPAKLSILFYYLIFFMVLILIKYVSKKRLVFLAGIVMMSVILIYKDRSKLVITMLDIGQGDAIVIEAMNHGVLVIDGGSSTLKDGGANIIEGFLHYRGYNRIDMHILTHSDMDHLLGIKNMVEEGYCVKKAVLPDISEKDKAYIKFEDILKKNHIEMSYISKGEKIRIGEIELFCLNPIKNKSYSKANEYSTVLYLKYKGFDALFTGDAELTTEEDLLIQKLPDIDVLKVAHHGSKNSTFDEFLDRVKAEYALVSCGFHNRYGHPHKDLLNRLKNKKIQVYRTDRNGAIEIRTDGKRLGIKSSMD